MRDETRVENGKHIADFKFDLINRRKQEGALIPLLQSAQDSYGFIPEKVIHYISEVVNIPAADIYGVITFYSQFRLTPPGKYIIRICEGTACHVNGARTILQILQEQLAISVDETTEDGLFTLQSVACLGCCSLSPVIMVGSDTHGNLDAAKTKKVIRKYRDMADANR